jgi:hypothetical protein
MRMLQPVGQLVVELPPSTQVTIAATINGRYGRDADARA